MIFQNETTEGEPHNMGKLERLEYKATSFLRGNPGAETHHFSSDNKQLKHGWLYQSRCWFLGPTDSYPSKPSSMSLPL